MQHSDLPRDIPLPGEDDGAVLSVRIVVLDHVMKERGPLEPGLTPGCAKWFVQLPDKVPVLRVFGNFTENGMLPSDSDRACVHVHGCFPYLLISRLMNPSSITQTEDEMHQESAKIGMALELALAQERAKQLANVDELKFPKKKSSSEARVVGVAPIQALPFYGYHQEPHLFYKIWLSDPRDIAIAASLFQSGRINHQLWVVHESHLGYHLQFLTDLGLAGMDWMHLAWYTDISNDHIGSTLQLHTSVSCILNKKQFQNDNVTEDPRARMPTLNSLWREEAVRREELGIQPYVNGDNKDAQAVSEESCARPWEKRFLKSALAYLSSIEYSDAAVNPTILSLPTFQSAQLILSIHRSPNRPLLIDDCCHPTNQGGNDAPASSFSTGTPSRQERSSVTLEESTAENLLQWLLDAQSPNVVSELDNNPEIPQNISEPPSDSLGRFFRDRDIHIGSDSLEESDAYDENYFHGDSNEFSVSSQLIPVEVSKVNAYRDADALSAFDFPGEISHRELDSSSDEDVEMQEYTVGKIKQYDGVDEQGMEDTGNSYQFSSTENRKRFKNLILSLPEYHKVREIANTAQRTGKMNSFNNLDSMPPLPGAWSPISKGTMSPDWNIPATNVLGPNSPTKDTAHSNTPYFQLSLPTQSGRDMLVESLQLHSISPLQYLKNAPRLSDILGDLKINNISEQVHSAPYFGDGDHKETNRKRFFFGKSFRVHMATNVQDFPLFNERINEFLDCSQDRITIDFTQSRFLQKSPKHWMYLQDSPTSEEAQRSLLDYPNSTNIVSRTHSLLTQLDCDPGCIPLPTAKSKIYSKARRDEQLRCLAVEVFGTYFKMN
jgi:hypothetical protein